MVFRGLDTEPGGSPLDETKKFRIASLTKIFTQLALLRLSDQGLLDLDAPLSDYRPGLGSSWADQVTVRQLLSFRSGLPREWEGDPETSGVSFDAGGLAGPFLDGLAAIGPSVEPGTRTQYSNLGYMGPDGRAVRYGFGAQPADPAHIREKRHATIGFSP